ncbi:E3 ubiquitin-ligase RING1a isoform B [Micractinium conductrix]|uniref:E3 ubiquitin-ligase RING1a isoform B n=1 Tax=Micractinium conductrix TaxID=554055 RepID=A0A2P6VM96_9CHLO|nr:E3 ubiquitin-ligase RING1a isoform B [Micractinium conductrix]|eukprot:PSC75175.1 E3 ubiquitin-ligase RING1a isoform B [Micractinium conductrix]
MEASVSGMEERAAAGEQTKQEQPDAQEQEEQGPAPACEEQDGVPRPRLKVTLELDAVLEHCRCSICMGIVKNARTVSACMHRFCKDCIEAWLRTQIENNCPQCRAKFASKRDCKADPSFDLLLGALFGDIPDFERRMLDPSAEVLEAARAVGVQIAWAKHQVAILPRSLARAATPPDGSKRTATTAAAMPAAAPAAGAQQWLGEEADAVVTVIRPSGIVIPGTKRPPNEGTGGPNKRLKPPGDDEEGLQFRGVRFQGDNWQARTKRNGKELSLGLYNSAEEAGMAYDIDRLHQQGGKAQRLNFPLLRAHYKAILTDLSDIYTPDGLLDFLAVAVQAAIKASRVVPSATAPKHTGPAAASAVNSTRRPEGQPVEPPQQQPALQQQQQQQQQQKEQQRRQAPPAGRVDAGTAVATAAATTAAAAAAALSTEEMQAVSARRAEQLAVERSLAAGLAGGMAHVRLLRGSGPAWRMAYLVCPVGATMVQVAEAVAAGLAQQHALEASSLRVGLAVANDLDASADFDALCAQDGADGNLLLRGHVAIRDLLMALPSRPSWPEPADGAVPGDVRQHSSHCLSVATVNSNAKLVASLGVVGGLTVLVAGGVLFREQISLCRNLLPLRGVGIPRIAYHHGGSNYLYGLTSVDTASYVLGSWLGMLPGTFAYVAAGAAGQQLLQSGSGLDAPQWWQVGAALAISGVTLGYVGKLATKAGR